MTDREKLIELLSEDMVEYCNVDIIAGHCKIRAITFDVDSFADHLLANGVTFQKWIPVTERLPDWRDGKVLVSTKYGMSICKRTVNGRWKGQHANWITHWMPLPEPPKEVDK